MSGRIGDLVARVVMSQPDPPSDVAMRPRERRWLAAPDLACTLDGTFPQDRWIAEYYYKRQMRREATRAEI